MSERLHLETVCPNNHNLTVTLTKEEFEAALKSDTLLFHCNTCDTDFTPSTEDIAKLRKEFSRNEA